MIFPCGQNWVCSYNFSSCSKRYEANSFPDLQVHVQILLLIIHHLKRKDNMITNKCPELTKYEKLNHPMTQRDKTIKHVNKTLQT